MIENNCQYKFIGILYASPGKGYCRSFGRALKGESSRFIIGLEEEESSRVSSLMVHFLKDFGKSKETVQTISLENKSQKALG